MNSMMNISKIIHLKDVHFAFTMNKVQDKGKNAAVWPERQKFRQMTKRIIDMRAL